MLPAPATRGMNIAAVAVIADGAFVVAKIGPAVARIWHIAMEAMDIFTLTAVAAAVIIVATCMTAHVIRTGVRPAAMLLQTVPPGTVNPVVRPTASLDVWPVAAPARCCGLSPMAATGRRRARCASPRERAG